MLGWIQAAMQQNTIVISRIQSFFCATFFSYSNDFVEKGTKNRLTWIVTQNYIHMPILPYFFWKKPHSFHLLFRALTFSWLGVSKYNFFWTESCSTNLLWFWVLHSLHTKGQLISEANFKFSFEPKNEQNPFLMWPIFRG